MLANTSSSTIWKQYAEKKPCELAISQTVTLKYRAFSIYFDKLNSNPECICLFRCYINDFISSLQEQHCIHISWGHPINTLGKMNLGAFYFLQGKCFLIFLISLYVNKCLNGFSSPRVKKQLLLTYYPFPSFKRWCTFVYYP